MWIGEVSTSWIDRAVACNMKEPVFQNSPELIDVFGIHIRRLRTKEVLQILKGFMQDYRPHSVYIVNAGTANLAYRDSRYRALLNRGDLVLNDGTGMRWAARWQGVRLEDNHVGTDLIPRLCDECQGWGMRVFLLGGRPGIAARAGSVLSSQFPGLKIAGHHDGYVGPADDQALCRQINAARPDLLLVAMGNPLQEVWIDRNLPDLMKGVAVGVGGLFDHLAGELRRAPLKIRQAGFEWLHILVQQPHKWRRYVIGNPLFLYRMTLGRVREG